MRPFQLLQPESLDEVYTLLADHGADDTHLIAGGTSLVVLMNLGLIQPARVVSLRRIAALRGIASTSDGGLEIKALATHRQLELSADVQAYCPAWRKPSDTWRRSASATRPPLAATWHTPIRHRIHRRC
jgi:xanthine dehydrogenase YagS FAD-binding subunit